MCGIVGIFSNQNIRHLKKVVNKMNELQSHRGPDDEGLWLSNNGKVIFGHKRLSIIDLSSKGRQPMESYDKRFTIVFNGEIYNHKKLQKECIKKGSYFRTLTDTEVIIEYIRHFGIKGIKEFRGMWAFVIYDNQKEEVIISRDPFGIKPLHYGVIDNVLYFASEIKSLRCTQKQFSTVNEKKMNSFINGGLLDIGETTFFNKIKRFPHAHYSVVDIKEPIRVICERDWKPPLKSNAISEHEAINEVDRLLSQSIQRHMVSDVPVSFCLSGGLDSSTTVGIAATLPEKGTLNTFTTHYPNYPEIDETKWARIAVNHCSTNSHWIIPEYRKDFCDEIDNLLHHHDEPFVSTSMFAQNAIFKAIHSTGIKVSIDGQGGDELFAGYSYYYPALAYSFLKNNNIISFLNLLFLLIVNDPKIILEIRRAFFTGGLGRMKRRLQKHGSKENPLIFDNDGSYFHSFLIESFMSTSLPTLLRYGDRASMKHHVESRVPYLDVDLVNFVISLPDNFKIRNAVSKYILRQVAYKYLPPELVSRKDKLGFDAPERKWMKKIIGVNVKKTSSKDFRKFIVNRWLNVVDKSRP